MTTTRRLAAILAADVAGYSRLMAADEMGTLEALKAARREVVDPAIADHRGRIVKTTGDGMLVEFASAVDAVTCAMAVQEAMAVRGSNIIFRIGINVGDIIIDGDDIFGDGVNVAARVENECEPGGVCLSAQAFDQVRNKTAFAFDDLGERFLKNIDRPIRLYTTRSKVPATITVSLPGPGNPLPLPDKPSIAVLPFQNMSGDPEQEYFADGVVEDIITALSRFKQLFVIARNSSFSYKNISPDVRQVGRELGVRYVLEGSVRKSANRVRITGQLVDTVLGVHLWADRFEGSLEDVFALQDQVTSSVVGLIAPKIEQAEIERALRKSTELLDSYDFFLRGMELYYKRQFGQARDFFIKASERDPDYAIAYATAALMFAGQQGLAGQNDAKLTDEMRAEALRLANIGARLAKDDPLSLARCGHTIAYFDREDDRGASMVEQAVALNPNLAPAWNSLGWVSLFFWRGDRSIESFNTMLRLSPLDPLKASAWSGISWALWMQGRHEEGRELAIKANREFTNVQSMGAYIANSVASGLVTEARSMVAELLKLDNGFCISQALDRLPLRPLPLREKLAFSFREAGLPE
jgi:adenylate cyclase